MQRESGQAKVAKRSSNACVRCRQQKIRCTGRRPCDKCSKRNLPCEFDGREQRITVTRGYIDDLHEAAAAGSAQGHGNGLPEDGGFTPDANLRTLTRTSRNHARALEQATPRVQSKPGIVDMSLINPLSTGHSIFMTATNGRTLYLGPSSNWAFARRVLGMTHEYVYQSPLPTALLLFDGCTYDLSWDGSRRSENPSSPALPTLDYAVYLINAVRFHCGQILHLFDEATFMKCLHEYYATPAPDIADKELWYIHFLLILAFGKAFVTRKNQGNKPPGHDFFVAALRKLPDTIYLLREPVLSTEILCCIALYLQCIDYRLMAHVYIGQALRMALGQGMHTNLPIQLLGEPLVERFRRAWWTTYVLDREMTSLQGLPHSIHDEDAYDELPAFAGSVQQRTVLSMRVRLSRIMAKINRTVYGADGKLDSKSLLSTKNVLADVAGVDDLRQGFPLQLETEGDVGVSRTSAHLHLLYHQCIVLAIRPLLFCFLRIRLESPGNLAATLNSSQTVRNLLQMCDESSAQIINILDGLQAQGLLETFLPFDLECLFVASVNLLVGLALDCHLRENRSAGLQRAYSVFDEMNAGGNLIAQSEKIELQQLEEMLVRLSVDRSDRVAADNNASVPDGRRFGHPSEDAVSTTTAP